MVTTHLRIDDPKLLLTVKENEIKKIKSVIGQKLEDIWVQQCIFDSDKENSLIGEVELVFSHSKITLAESHLGIELENRQMFRQKPTSQFQWQVRSLKKTPAFIPIINNKLDEFRLVVEPGIFGPGKTLLTVGALFHFKNGPLLFENSSTMRKTTENRIHVGADMADFAFVSIAFG